LFEKEILKFLLTSLFAVFLLFFVYYLVKRFNLFLPKVGKNRYLKLLEVLPVGKDSYLVLVEVDNIRLLLAFTGSAVRLIKEFKVEDGNRNG